MSKKKFSPDSEMPRKMFAAALGRLAGIDSTNYTINSFTDVDIIKYYAPYTAWAVWKGIVSKINNKTFEPDRTVTR